MARGAGAGAATEAAGLETMLTDDFHDPPAFHGREFVVLSVQIRYANDAHWLNRSSVSTVGLRALVLSA